MNRAITLLPLHAFKAKIGKILPFYVACTFMGDNIEMKFKEIGRKGMEWIHLVQDGE
jgi:hypothetical protein